MDRSFGLTPWYKKIERNKGVVRQRECRVEEENRLERLLKPVTAAAAVAKCYDKIRDLC